MSRFELPARLEITNGTDTVDLLRGPFFLLNWRPNTPKDVVEGPYRQWARRINEVFNLQLSTSDPDESAYQYRMLEKLIEQARNYAGTSWEIRPVYLVVQGRGETQIRYALIVSGRLPDAENPFGQHYQGGYYGRPKSLMTQLSLGIERENWTASPPREGDTLNFNTIHLAQMVDNWAFNDWTGTTIDYWTQVGTVNSLTENTDLNYVWQGSSSALLVSGGTGYVNQPFGTTSAYYQADVTRFYARAWVYVVSGAAILQLLDGSRSSTQTTEATGWQLLQCDLAYGSGTPAVRVGVTDGSVYLGLVEAGYIMGAVADDGTREEVPFSFLTNSNVKTNLTHIRGLSTSGISTGWLTQEYQRIDASGWDIPPTEAGPKSAEEVYFIWEKLTGTAVAPPNGLVFNLTEPAIEYSFTWHYWDGSAWTALTTGGNDDLTELGHTCVSWEQPSDFTIDNLNTVLGGSAPNIDGYFVRLTATITGLNFPARQVGYVYSPNINYFTVEDPGGDLAALLRLKLKPYYYANSAVSQRNVIIAGARSLRRGVNFESFIHFYTNSHNVRGITVTHSGTTPGATNYPTGKRMSYTLTSSADQNVATITIDGVTAKSYSGRFRAFLIAEVQATTGDDYGFYLKYTYAEQTITNPTAFPPTNGFLAHVVFDLGSVYIDQAYDEYWPTLEFEIRAVNTTGATYTNQYSAFVLIPADEWVGELQGSSFVYTNKTVVVDSVTDQGKRRLIRTYEVDEDTNQHIKNYASRVSQPLSLSAYNTEEQRVYVIMGVQLSTNMLVAEMDNNFRVTGEIQQQYMVLRGET